MRFSFKLVIDIPNDYFGDLPTREQVRVFLEKEALLSGGNYFPGDEETAADLEWALYRYATVKVV